MLKQIIPLALFAAVFGIVYVFLMVRHREKMYMMQHKLDPEEYGPKLFSSLYQTLKAGMLLIGLGIGLVVGYFLDEIGFDNDIAYPTALLMFGGLSLVLHYFIEKSSYDR